MGAWVPLQGRQPQLLLERFCPMRQPFLLETARLPLGGAGYSFLGGDPVLTVRATPAGVQIDRPGRATEVSPDGPLRTLRTLLADWHTPRPAGFPPFFAGACGVVSYDFSRRLERLPEIAADDLSLPDMDLSFYDLVVGVDHAAERLWVTWVPEPGMRRKLGREVLYSVGLGRIGAALSWLRDAPPERSAAPGHVGPFTAETGRAEYTAMVRTAQELIARGDIFQANLSQRFHAPVSGVDAWHLYGVLSEVNPAPFACYLDRGDYQVVSSSPERLASLREGRVEARPIAGTRPRGADSAGDVANGAELLSSPKEQAEHVMLVDLTRNDLGRVCDYGSVRVTEFMSMERYSHVIHIVSNVAGDLGPGQDAVSVLRAVFPGGTITGAPKVRCMEIIEELEPVRRGVYTGSAGYLSAGGEMDLNILIRTVLLKDGVAFFQAGAGIVADSSPEAEYKETLHKAEAMRRALERAGGGGEVAAVASGAPPAPMGLTA